MDKRKSDLQKEYSSSSAEHGRILHSKRPSYRVGVYQIAETPPFHRIILGVAHIFEFPLGLICSIF